MIKATGIFPREGTSPGLVCNTIPSVPGVIVLMLMAIITNPVLQSLLITKPQRC
jgi:hypothetical protein